MQFFGSITTNSIKGNSKILIFYLTVAQNENFVYKVKDQLYLYSLNDDFRSMPVSEKLRVYAFPSPKLTLTCYHLSVIRLREGYGCFCSDTDIDLRLQ